MVNRVNMGVGRGGCGGVIRYLKKPYLHEILPGDEALSMQRMKQSANMLLILV